MRNWILPLLLVAVSPALFAAPERVADVLKDFNAHGYASPSAAIARLQSAQDAGDTNAPLEQRRRYYAELITLALPNHDTALLQNALTALQGMAQHEHCTPCQAIWLIGKARAATLQRKPTQARAYLKQAAALIPANNAAMQLTLAMAEARAGRAQGTLNLAFRSASKALDLSEKLGDHASHVLTLNDIAVTEADLGFLDRATTTAQQAVDRAKAIGFTAALARGRINQAYVASLRNDRPAELHALHQALAITARAPGLSHVEAVAHGDLSDYYLHAGDYASTLKEARLAADAASAKGELYIESVAVANIGIAQARMGQSKAGVASLRKSLEMARQSGRLQLEVVVNKELVKILKAAGQYQAAVEALQASAGVNKKITQQKRDNAVLELQAKYDDKRKTREIERLTTEARLKSAEASAQRWRQSLWITLAAIAGLATLLMVFRLLRARRANRKLVTDVANLTEQSSLDELTGVFNRRHFVNLMEPYDHDASARVGLVMLDIDHFKRINDSLGHDAGDIVLKEVARRLQSLVRDHDHVVRWGGEEFVLVLPDASPQGLPSMARRLLDSVAARPVTVRQHKVNVSISAGCVVHPAVAGSPWEQALRLADLTMYQAKRGGRNRAICVTGVNGELGADLADGDLAAAIQAGTITVTEIAGPAPRPAAPAT